MVCGERSDPFLFTIRAEALHHSVVFYNGHIGRNLLNKFLSLHILMINREFILPTVSSGYSELYCRSGAQSRAS